MDGNNEELTGMEKLKNTVEANKRLFVLIAIFFVLLIVSFVLNLYIFGDDMVNDDPEDEQKEVSEEEIDEKDALDMLPDTGVDEAEEELDPDDVYDELKEDDTAFADPFSGPMELKGVVHEGGRESYAIVSADENSKVVTRGDTIFDGWEVIEIRENSIILEIGDRSTEIKLD